MTISGSGGFAVALEQPRPAVRRIDLAAEHLGPVTEPLEPTMLELDASDRGRLRDEA
jgi:hypothetical protein